MTSENKNKNTSSRRTQESSSIAELAVEMTISEQCLEIVKKAYKPKKRKENVHRYVDKEGYIVSVKFIPPIVAPNRSGFSPAVSEDTTSETETATESETEEKSKTDEKHFDVSVKYDGKKD